VKKRTGRPPYKPKDFDRGRVAVWAEAGIPQRVIAYRIDCALVTLRKHFAEELAFGSEAASADVAERLYAVAMGKHGASVRDQLLAQMFWLKCRRGWKDHQTVTVQNPDGTALFEDWPDAKLAAVTRRALEVLEKKGKREKKATG
jgi:hypothetical protein